MFPMDRMPLPVTVEYSSRGKRVRKTFENSIHAARRFYIAKAKAGANPKVLRPEEVAEAERTLFDPPTPA